MTELEKWELDGKGGEVGRVRSRQVWNEATILVDFFTGWVLSRSQGFTPLYSTQLIIVGYGSKFQCVVLGGVMVIVLAIGPKVHGFKPGLERWNFKGDKNSCYEILRRGVIDTDRKNSVAYSHQNSPRFATWCVCCNQIRELWWMNREGTELRWGAQQIRKWRQCMGRFVRYHTVTVTSNNKIQCHLWHEWK
jgi:hypothetical protein